jgi:hypothetical protein
VRRRHLYMGFYDPDEYGLLDPALLQAAWAGGDNALLQLFGMYGLPPTVALPNRFGAVVEPLYSAALSPSTALARSWYGREEVESARSKSWHRTMGMREDINLGNHDLFVFKELREDPTTGTVLMSGSGYEMLRMRQAIYTLEADATMLHVFNFKEHVSKLPFDQSEAVANMTLRAVQRGEARAMFERARELCLACPQGVAAAPGCGYEC